MNRTKIIFCALFFSSLAFTMQEASDIVRYGEKQLRGESTEALMIMTVTRPDFSRELKLRSWTAHSQKALVEILRPAKEEGVSSLRVNAQMWNYLPKTDQVMRVPSSLMLQSWMGSDFTNDDLMKASSLSIDYTHKILRHEKLDGEGTLLIECLPKPDAPVVWGKILYWARSSDQLPVKEEYYDDHAKLIRTMALSHFKKIEDRIFPMTMTVTNAESPKETTTVVYEKIVFNRKLDETLFEQDTLRQTSQQGKNPSTGWASEPLVP